LITPVGGVSKFVAMYRELQVSLYLALFEGLSSRKTLTTLEVPSSKAITMVEVLTKDSQWV
jgi:hypothetical protein